jgi:hypothetical protein
MPGLEEVNVGDLLYVIFRTGFVASFIPSKDSRIMEVIRHKPQRSGLTSVVGTLSEITVLPTGNQVFTLFGGPPRFVNSEFRGIAQAPGFQEGKGGATIRIGMNFISRMEKIVVNPDANNDEHYTSPGQQGLGAARFNPRYLRIPIHLFSPR